ncbi:unnamed protein product [Cylicocyclus nassatus]|uniref:Uncharacterized protein n=1 Tax=Cylicocyclus nassatus TaxID=53992 RepID=A0AA36GR53_CYLNA|nr:unnamed protein product [Cylicocyclus nassatus]
MLAILALWILYTATVTSASAIENKLITHLRKRIENNQVKFQRRFEFQQLCNSGIAMYTISRGFWKCETENDCPYGYDCTRSKKSSRVCCPTKDLCRVGCPISNSTGIWACHRNEDCPLKTICGDSLLMRMNGERPTVCCMNEHICENGLPQLDAFNPYPVLHECYTMQDCRDGFICGINDGDLTKKGICCPDRPYPRTLTPEEKEHFKQFPLIGIPSLLLGLTCYLYIKDEFERRDEERRKSSFTILSMDIKAIFQRKAQRMRSAEIKESEFQNKGVLKLSEEIGEIRHALEDESSFSLSSVSFEPKYNEIVLIGSAVESVETAAEEHTQSSLENKSLATARSQSKASESSLSKKSKLPPSTSTEQKSAKTTSPEKSALTSPKTKSSMVKSAGKTSSPGTSVRSTISTPSLKSTKSTKAPRPLKIISRSTSAGPTIARDASRRKPSTQMPGQARSSRAESSVIPSVSASKAKRYVGKFVEPNINREVNSEDRSSSGSDMNDF